MNTSDTVALASAIKDAYEANRKLLDVLGELETHQDMSDTELRIIRNGANWTTAANLNLTKFHVSMTFSLAIDALEGEE